MSSNFVNQSILYKFAGEHKLSLICTPPRQHIPGRRITFKTIQDEETAQEMLRASKDAKIEALWRIRRLLVTKKSRNTFSDKEIHTELFTAVKVGTNPGLVEVLRDLLIEAGGDLNFTQRERKIIWKCMGRQPAVRSNYLSTAAADTKVDLVQILAPFSDQISLDDSLDIALQAQTYGRELLIPEYVLAYGADASYQDGALAAAIKSRDVEMINLLINAKKPMSRDGISERLFSTVKLGYLDVLILLISAGADANGADGKGDAVKEAIRTGRKDLLVALTLCVTKPSRQVLDEGMRITFAFGINVPSAQRSLMEVLLDSGAAGPCTDACLITITMELVTTSSSDSVLISMLELLISYGASINAQGSAALKAVVSNTRLDLASILLRAPILDETLASEAFGEIDPNATPKQRLDLASQLIDRGAQGSRVHEALVSAVRDDDFQAIKMLVLRNNANKASVDYRNALALQDAVSREQLPIVGILLEASPTIESLAYAFPHIRKTSKEGRIVLTQAFLNGGAKGVEVDRALAMAIEDKSPMRDERLLRMLVENGAAVDTHVEHAVQKGDTDLLAILIVGGPSVEVTSRALQSAVKFDDENQRMRLLYLLLDAKADVNYDNGYVVFQAVDSVDVPALTMLLQCLPQPQSLDAAFAAAISTTDISECCELCLHLLGAGASGIEVDKALGIAVAEKPESLELLKIVLPAADPNFDGGRALCIAIQQRLSEHAVMITGRDLAPLTYRNAFDAAFSLKDERSQLRYCQIMLNTNPSNEVTDNALLMAVIAQQFKSASLLLQYGASVDHDNGAVLRSAIASTNSRILHLLLKKTMKKPLPETLDSALGACLSIQNGPTKQELLEITLHAGVRIEFLSNALIGLVQVKQPDCPSVEALLKYGASVYHNENASLAISARMCHFDVLRALLSCANDNSAVTQVFADRLQDDVFWATSQGLQIMELLLKNGASGRIVDEALIIAVANNQREPLTLDFVKILLDSGADVNHKQGIALTQSVRTGSVELMKEILKRRCTSETLALAFPYILDLTLGAPAIIELMDAFAQHPNQKFRKPFAHPLIPLPVVTYCMTKFPKNLSILIAVLDAGFPVDDKKGCKVACANFLVEVTPLYWALADSTKAVDDSIIAHLLKWDASIEGHPEPLLHVAIRTQRLLVLLCLVQAGVNLDYTDNQGRTALEYAIEIGDVTSMSILINFSCEVAEDALHIAARSLNADATVLLMKQGHDPSKPSVEHQGRSPLAELLVSAPFYAQNSSPQKIEKEARKTIQALINGGARTQTRFPNSPNGRSLLLHALDSTEPYMMTKIFLDCGQFHHINADCNLYTDNGYTYSPTMYVAKGICRSNPASQGQLVSLLKQYGATDRYWRNRGEQPADMINPPASIQRAEAMRIEEMEKRKQMIENLQFKNALKESEVNHKLHLQDREHAFTKSQIEENRHLKLEFLHNTAQLSQSALDQRIAAELYQARTIGQIQIDLSKQHLNLSHERNMQALGYEDGMHDRRERHQDANRRWRTHELEAGNAYLEAKERYVEKKTGLIDRQIELGMETRRVADKAMGYNNWQQSGGAGGRRILGEKSMNYGQGQIIDIPRRVAGRPEQLRITEM